MKYIKSYEKLLKFDDPHVISHPLLQFSTQLEKILKMVQNADNYKGSIIKKYFNSNGEILICHKSEIGDDFFRFKIFEDKNDITMIIKYARYFQSGYNKNSEYLFNFIIDNLKQYVININTFPIYLKFPKTETNNIIEKMEEINIYFTSNKYNL